MSKEIELTRGLKAIVDDDDYDWLNEMSWYAQCDTRGKMYAATSIMDSIEYMQVLVLDEEGDIKVDHINGDTLDNRKENLRATSTSENAMNRVKTKNNKSSKFKGVTKMKNGKWKAHIGIDDKDIHIGYFKSEEEAAKAYDEKATTMFGDKAKLNFE